MQHLLYAFLVSGFVLITLGVIIKTYPYRFNFNDLRNKLTLEKAAESKLLFPILSFLGGKQSSRRYLFAQKVITKSETEVSVRALYLLKFMSVITVAAIAILITYTNMDVLKLSIISKTQQEYQIFNVSVMEDYSHNAAIYMAAVDRIGEYTLSKLDREGKLAQFKKVLPSIMGTGEKEIIEQKALSLTKAYDLVSRLNPLNLKVVLFIIISFWLPEIVLFIKRLLLGNKYRKEVIKLENVFELLGSMRNFKTINILDEMAKASKTYCRHLESTRELFKTDKEQALEALKLSVKNSRFSRLVDILRIYSMTDKKLALQIMERNRLEKEEELLLTAEEDVDMVDLIAFLSIIPILLQLANLFMKPMLDTIYEAFKFI